VIGTGGITITQNSDTIEIKQSVGNVTTFPLGNLTDVTITNVTNFDNQWG